ncbi:hypothetical protein Fot_28711 [Forsythia ovata]|uniref:Uncharacterized protein n=1 Tax=Forsythia ovata TaxID=205694 RepID=A0ABD1TPR9_9LAMI
MKVNELRSTVTGIEDIDELHYEKKILCSRLVVSEDARTQAEFKIIKSKTIQRFSVSARKQVELKLKVCEDMDYTKHKQLTKALAELWMAILWVSGYTDSKVSAEVYEP